MNIHKPTILLVDDDPDILALLSRKFTAANYEVILSSDGEDALVKLASHKIDVLISDIHMPKMDGIELAKRTKGVSQNKEIRIFIMSGAADQDALKTLTQLGITEVIPKPISPAEIVKMANDVLRQQAERRKLPKEQILQCYLRGTIEIIQHYSQIVLKYGELATSTAPALTGDLSGTISFSGSGIVGFVSLVIGRDFADTLEEKIFGNGSGHVDETMMAHLIGELLMQSVARTQVYLNEIGIQIGIALPNVVVGNNHTLFQRAHNPIIIAPIVLAEQKICHLEICLAGSGSSGASTNAVIGQLHSIKPPKSFIGQ